MLTRNLKDTYLKILEERIQATKETICQGRLTPEEYLRDCAFIRGLESAKDDFEDIYRKYQKDEIDDPLF
jgi:hypothetical protein